MKTIFRIVAILLFIVFFGFALKNTDEATLNLFGNYALGGPLVLMLLGFFICGASFGILAMLPTLFRYRREAGIQRKRADALERDKLVTNVQPLVDSVAPR